MNRRLWFSKMSQKKLSIRYISMTAVNQTFLSKTSLQQFGELLTSSSFLAPWCHKTCIHHGSCDVTILSISLRVTKKQQSNNIGLRTIYPWTRISLMLRAGLLLNKGNLSASDFFLSGRRNNEESLKQSIKYYSHTQYLRYILFTIVNNLKLQGLRKR